MGGPAKGVPRRKRNRGAGPSAALPGAGGSGAEGPLAQELPISLLSSPRGWWLLRMGRRGG